MIAIPIPKSGYSRTSELISRCYSKARCYRHRLYAPQQHLSMTCQLFSLAYVYVIRNHVCCKCHNSDAKTGEEITKHGAVAEDGVFTPRFPLCPRVSKKGEI